MKKILAVFGILSAFSCLGQLGNSSQLITTHNDTIEVIQTANFSIGNGPTCPHIESYTSNIVNGEIIFDVYYNVQGAWPQNGCTAIDTLFEQIGSGTYDVIVNSYQIGYDSTFITESDTTYFVTFSMFPAQKELLRVVDLMGRDTDKKPNTLLIYVYSDGTVERVFEIE